MFICFFKLVSDGCKRRDHEMPMTPQPASKLRLAAMREAKRSTEAATLNEHPSKRQEANHD
jgi:hypothetical protein